MTTVLGGGREAAVSTAPAATSDYIPDEAWYGRAREPFGSAALDLAIGRLAVRIEGMSGSQRDRLGERFHPFVGAPAGAASPLRLLLTRAERDRFLALPEGVAEKYRMGRRSTESARDWWSYEFAGRIRPLERSA